MLQKERKLQTPAKLNAPLSKTHRQKVELALKEERKKTSSLKKQIEQMKKEINEQVRALE